jgi:hypothetical protein
MQFTPVNQLQYTCRRKSLRNASYPKTICRLKLSLRNDIAYPCGNKCWGMTLNYDTKNYTWRVDEFVCLFQRRFQARVLQLFQHLIPPFVIIKNVVDLPNEFISWPVWELNQNYCKPESLLTHIARLINPAPPGWLYIGLGFSMI